jgi:hypothetical protein
MADPRFWEKDVRNPILVSLKSSIPSYCFELLKFSLAYVLGTKKANKEENPSTLRFLDHNMLHMPLYTPAHPRTHARKERVDCYAAI